MPDPVSLETSMYPTMAPTGPATSPPGTTPKGADATLDALAKAMYPTMPQGPDAEHADAKAEAEKGREPTGDRTAKPTPGIPEGFVPGPGFDRYQEAVKELGLSPDASVRLIETYQAAKDAQRDAWADAAQADPEIGGAAFQRELDYARQALKTYGTPGLHEALESTGLGNHPELIRLLSKVGRSL